MKKSSTVAAKQSRNIARFVRTILYLYIGRAGQVPVPVL